MKNGCFIVGIVYQSFIESQQTIFSNLLGFLDELLGRLNTTLTHFALMSMQFLHHFLMKIPMQ